MLQSAQRANKTGTGSSIGSQYLFRCQLLPCLFYIVSFLLYFLLAGYSVFPSLRQLNLPLLFQSVSLLRLIYIGPYFSLVNKIAAVEPVVVVLELWSPSSMFSVLLARP